MASLHSTCMPVEKDATGEFILSPDSLVKVRSEDRNSASNRRSFDRPDALKEKEIRVPIMEVNYSEVDALAKTLESDDVHTVISTIFTLEGSDPEIALIRSAEQSPATKQYLA
ncbi:hypothetical protein ACJ41O_008832 [Fusarium nematophilum]